MRRDAANELRAAEADLAFSGLYVIGPRNGWPTCFGVAKQAADAWHAIKRGHWDLHQIHAFIWTPGKPAAERIKKALAERLADNRSFENPEWYDLTAAEVIAHLEDVAKRERVELFNDVEKMRRIEKRAEARLGKMLSGYQPKQLPKPRLVKG